MAAPIRLKQLDGVTSSDVDVDSRTISNVASPSTGDQAANKTYVDSVAGVTTGRLSMAGPIKSITVEAATDTINLTGLNFDEDGEYDIVLSIVDDATGGSAYSIYAGDPTVDATATNYDTTRINDGVAVSGSSDAIFGTTGANGQVVSGRLRVNQDPNGRFIVIGETAQRPAPQSNQLAVRSVNAFGSISAIRISASSASGIGVGSYVRVYRKGGTLSTGTSITPLDVKRAADGFDDEFDSTTLDSSWTVGGTGTAGTVSFAGEGALSNPIYDLSTRPGWCLLQFAQSQTIKLSKPVSLAVGESLITCLAPSAQGPGSGDNSVYLNFSLQSSVISPTNWIAFSIIEQDANTELEAVVNSAMSGEKDVEYNLPLPSGKMYLRYTRTTNYYTCSTSYDGTSWFRLGKISYTGSLGYIVFDIRGNGGALSAPYPIVGIDWIRKGTADLDPWPLVDGSTVQPVVTGEWRGALARRTTTQSIAASTSVPLEWESVVEDTDGFFDVGGSNPERVTIPAGVSRVILRCNAQLASVTAGDSYLYIRKNGAVFNGMPYIDNYTTGEDYLTAVSAPVEVVEGDYFEAVVYSANSTSTGNGEYHWLSVEVLEPQVVLTDRGTVNVSSSDSPYTLPSTKKTIYVTADGATTINLPALAGNGDMEAEVKIISGNSTVTLDPNGSETIEGASTYAFSGVGESRTFRAKSINGNLGWYMVARASLDPATLVEFTCTATEQVNDLVYISAADTVSQADASAASTSDVIGWIFAKPTTTTCLVSFGPGPVTSSGLTPGARVYLSDTAGAVSSSEGTVIVEVGLAKSATEFLFLGAKQAI